MTKHRQLASPLEE